MFFPRLSQLYSLTLRRLQVLHHLVNSYFPNSRFAAQSLNIDDQVLAIKHTDLMDLVFGICGILPLGDFNPRTSAQLVLEEPRLIIELRPGDIFFFPSATIHHYSIPMVSQDETRQSMIFYSAGGLFRWVKQGFQTQTNMSPEEKAACESLEAGAKRWENAWKLFSNISEFET